MLRLRQSKQSNNGSGARALLKLYLPPPICVLLVEFDDVDKWGRRTAFCDRIVGAMRPKTERTSAAQGHGGSTHKRRREDGETADSDIPGAAGNERATSALHDCRCTFRSKLAAVLGPFAP